ncbi:MAG: methylated-DNA--[protein]-cysteine S-methyltransferase [Ruminococcaceae bacterium]|nr:methylated-DNA--[protein]-cysteine S-methyltransferase [Oscillospiraceae bacterium]
MEYRTVYPSPLGPLTLASDGAALTGLWLAGQRYFGGGAAAWEEKDDVPVFIDARLWLDSYFAGEEPAGDELPLLPAGTDFQQRVWQQLLQIPCGETRTYGDLAAALGSSARAVGGAVGRNPISIIIPCHRVLGADGSLTGYAGGTECKRWLLAHEELSRQE